MGRLLNRVGPFYVLNQRLCCRVESGCRIADRRRQQVAVGALIKESSFDSMGYSFGLPFHEVAQTLLIAPQKYELGLDRDSAEMARSLGEHDGGN